MKNLFLTFATGAAVLLAVGSCKKDETQVVLSNNAAPQLTASATTATILRNNTSPAVTYNWKTADFNYQAAVTYTLQFAKAGTNFANTVDYNVGSSLSKSFNQTELNDVYNSVDCTLPEPTATTPPTVLDVRVKASVGDAAAAQMATAKTISAVPYPAVKAPGDDWSLIGPAGDGWSTDRMMTYDCRVRGFVLRTALNAGPFKFRRNQDWTLNLGGATGDYTKGIPLTLNGADMVISTPGTYTITLVVNRNAANLPIDGKVTITP